MIDSAPNIMKRPGLRLSERGPAGVEYASASGRFCKPLPGIPAHARHRTRWSSEPRSPRIPWDENVFGGGHHIQYLHPCVPASSASLQCTLRRPSEVGGSHRRSICRASSRRQLPSSAVDITFVRSTSLKTLDHESMIVSYVP
ncbi:hypothetical protein L227DRAFT_370306 [Lentinus tigrinus ALCF2SS1-6]|uniref:Uncharacterized protein n=1 Tax=Lentinus tigrinus ALCF2SS1-6 TaxID=1328759 RepID=A0A5C2RR22_9APHY|nr:hypothetical protein L227DRAFT_370306 [Lentinus tigrinus ALCF2SS1-6]